MSCNCNNKNKRPKYLDLDVIYSGELTECNGFTIRPETNLRTIIDVLLKGCGQSETNEGTNLWFSPEMPVDFQAKENDYMLLGNGSIYKFNTVNWIDTGIKLGGSTEVNVNHGLVKNAQGVIGINQSEDNVYSDPFYLKSESEGVNYGLTLSPDEVSLTRDNVGALIFDEVIFLYIGDPDGTSTNSIRLSRNDLNLGTDDNSLSMQSSGLVLVHKNSVLEIKEESTTINSVDNGDNSIVSLQLNNTTGGIDVSSSKSMPMKYNGDYRANYDDRSLVDKSYVDSRTWSGTQAQYDALAVKDPNVLYLII